MSTYPAPTPSGEDLPGVERLLALSDGVVAIAITLLVLQRLVEFRVLVHHHPHAFHQ